MGAEVSYEVRIIHIKSITVQACNEREAIEISSDIPLSEWEEFILEPIAKATGDE